MQIDLECNLFFCLTYFIYILCGHNQIVPTNSKYVKIGVWTCYQKCACMPLMVDDKHYNAKPASYVLRHMQYMIHMISQSNVESTVNGLLYVYYRILYFVDGL